MSVRATGTGPTALRSFVFPDADATILTSLTTSITLATLTLNGSGLASLQANASGLAINILGRAADQAGYLQFFKNDGVTLEGGVHGGTGLVALFGPNAIDVFTVTNTGVASTGTVSGTDYTSTGSNGYNVANAAFFYWATRSALGSPASGQLNLTNNLLTVGVGVDFSVDAVLKIRTRAQSAYAQVDALGYSAGGVAGVTTFGPAAVASITVKGGIITAIS